MVEVTTVSAYTAGWAMEVLKPEPRVPTSIAAREARRIELRQEKEDADEDDLESTVPVIQSTEIALDLLNEGNRQPRSTVQHAIDSYVENE